MKYKVETSENEINIEVTETKGKQEKLLEAFQECQAILQSVLPFRAECPFHGRETWKD